MFKVDKVTAPHVNEAARMMARDLNYGTKSFKRVVDRLRDEYGPEYAMWVADKALGLVSLWPGNTAEKLGSIAGEIGK